MRLLQEERLSGNRTMISQEGIVIPLSEYIDALGKRIVVLLTQARNEYRAQEGSDYSFQKFRENLFQRPEFEGMANLVRFYGWDEYSPLGAFGKIDIDSGEFQDVITPT
ncbi:MAG: hypothetical protein PHY14_00740 [Candidatus Gracilibacteria bacterium]|nr:hypothetical protein [Candidatus Gracilibacteria bacterium]